MYRNFQELIESVKKTDTLKRVAVVAAHEKHTLEAVFHARNNGILEPILIGHENEIKDILRKLQTDPANIAIIDAPEDIAAAEKAVELIHKDQADFLMKGNIQTADLLRVVVRKENHFSVSNIMSHLVLYEIPNYHKLLAITDGGMMMYPNLEEKKAILENAVSVFLKLGYKEPKVAVLAAVEIVNPKMPESVDGDLLKKMNQEGKIKNCIVEGPISYDLMMSKESAAIKGYQSPVTGDADILIVPTISAGNMLGKALIYSAGAKIAGFIVGAKVPIVVTSRGSTSEEKYLSLVLSAAAATPFYEKEMKK